MNLWSAWREGEGELRSAWISCFPGAALLPSTQRWLCGPVMVVLAVALAMVLVVVAVLTVITVIAIIAVLGVIAVLAVIDHSPCCDGGGCVDGGPHCDRGCCGDGGPCCDGGPCHDPSCVRRGPRRAALGCLLRLAQRLCRSTCRRFWFVEQMPPDVAF